MLLAPLFVARNFKLSPDVEIAVVRVTPVLKDLVLLGGGHAHVHVLKQFGMHPIPGVRVTVISRDIVTPYSGMLPGFIAGHYSKEQCHIDLRPLARFAAARLIEGEGVSIDRTARTISLKSRPPIPYDVLSIDIGSTPDLSSTPGADAYATPVKPVDRLATRWVDVLRRVEDSSGPLDFVVVGGGAAGVEVMLAAQHRLRGLVKARGGDVSRLSFTLITRGKILESHNARVGKAFRQVLLDRGVRLVEDRPVAKVEKQAVVGEDGTQVPYSELLWVTDAGPARWLRQSGLELDAKGFIAIDEHLQSVNTEGVFAVGDIATSRVDPRPKAGVFAVRQGPPLVRNLRNALTGAPLRSFKPQTNFLSLISTGDKSAVASWGRFAAHGPSMWTLKDYIDRRFMRAYQELPSMTVTTNAADARPQAGDPLGALREAPMRCGGCGAKVGATTLSRVLARLAPKSTPYAVIGLDAPDDAAVLTAPPGRHLIQTVDFFRAFIDDPYLFGRITANHALSDIYAMGGQPLTALATATVPYGIESKVEEDLFQMLRGALDVFDESNCALVGGHSAEGAELALGFAINGAIDPDKIWRKGGMQIGDAIVLTKPIGTGIVFAGDMRGRAKAEWVSAALESMQQSNAGTAEVLREAGATACTDVTGFGLIGHLHEMLRASGVSCRLNFAAIPLLPGTIELAALGIASSLAPDNLRLKRAVTNFHEIADLPEAGVFFDPQTAGGLLASVPIKNVDDWEKQLSSRGYRGAAIIGTVIKSVENSAITFDLTAETGRKKS